jgi:hypothetical protein
MNSRPTMLVAFLVCGLVASLRAAAAPPISASALTNNKLLNGEYIGTSSRTCLVTAAGFDASSLEPKVPPGSNISVDTWEGIWTFNGAGSLSETGTMILIHHAAAEPRRRITPNASGATLKGFGKYAVTGHNEVAVTVVHESTRFFAGIRKGTTSGGPAYALVGHASSDGGNVILATRTPTIEPTSDTSGGLSQRICDRSVVLAKH